jgi:hypothetical protein
MKTVELRGGHRVRLLSVRQIMEVGDAFWSKQRDQILADLESAGVESEKRLEVLREHSSLRGSAFVLLRMTFQTEEADALIRLACEAASMPYADATDGMTPEDRTNAAQALLGFDPKARGRTASEAEPPTP